MSRMLFNEEMNQTIINNLINDHVENLDDWSMSINGDFIILNREGELHQFHNYSSMLEFLYEDIEEDIMNHSEYLNSQQIKYLGITPPEKVEHEVLDPEEEPHEEKTKTEDKISEGKSSFNDFKKLTQQIVSQITITEMAQECGFTIKRNGQHSYTTNEHDSLVLDASTNKFYWNSKPPTQESIDAARRRIEKTGKGTIPAVLSGNVIALYCYVNNISYKQAVLELGKRIDTSIEIKKQPIKPLDENKMTAEQRHKFLAKQLIENKYQNVNMSNAKAYLIKTRMINPEVVELFQKRNMIFQTEDTKGRTQVVFIGKDENGLLSSVCFRSTSSQNKFRGDYSGCNYERGWFFDPEVEAKFGTEAQPFDATKRLLVFESNIEMMSYMSLLKETNHDYNKFAYLSCGSISKNNCIYETCKLYGYKDVVVMFNNDFDKANNAGLNMARHVCEKLQEKGINAKPLVPSKCNDWNDTLVAFKQKKITLEYEKKKEVKLNKDR